MSRVERRGDARDRLLARLLVAFDEELPPPEASLREIAARTDTSHALLRYHFGSLPGVLAAMLTEQRSRDNAALAQAAQGGTFAELVTAIWHAYTRPDRRARVRGFFHVVGLATYHPEDFREFIDSLDDLTRMLALVAERDGLDAATALTTATVAISAIRGLLLQEVLVAAATPEALALITRMCQSQLPDEAAPPTSVAAGDRRRPRQVAPPNA